MRTVFLAVTTCVCRPTSSPVFGLISRRGKLLLETSILIRWPARNVFDVAGNVINISYTCPVSIITGFVRFPESGQFKLLALVNDGMRLYFSQGAKKPILDDPRKMSDRLVGTATITVEADVWYPLKLEYYQKKGTSALVLAWMRPGAGEGEKEVIKA